MVRAQGSAYPESVRQKASHCLFVEGESDGAFDVVIIQALLDSPGANIEVRPLGPSHKIRGAAEAIHKTHPDYYFLIDRDHQEDAFVEKCWMNFPDPNESNLLVWRRRELENYFIIPDYLCKSPHLKKGKTKADLERAILSSCQGRLYLDAANLVLIGIRERLKDKWIERFSDSVCFPTETDALAALKKRPEWAEFSNRSNLAHGRRISQKKAARYRPRVHGRADEA